MAATWATVADVLEYTNVTVTDAQLTLAGTIVDMACARAYEIDADRVGDRDLYWLKLAVCYQSAWVIAQPDLFQRMDLTVLGHSSTLTQFGPNAMILGPLAKFALKRVSWLKSRSLHVRSPFQDYQGAIGVDPLSSAVDGMYPWQPLS